MWFASWPKSRQGTVYSYVTASFSEEKEGRLNRGNVVTCV